MQFNGFSEEDFQSFLIDGLDERMEAIRERIQPKFKAIGNELVDDLTLLLGKEMYLHIAKHARRTKNPPNDTWLAISDNKRGYKAHPHFQVGLFDDHVFIWLAYIYDLPNKGKIAQNFLDNIENFKDKVPDDFDISLDHTKKNSDSFKEIDLSASLKRFRDVKKGEFLIGRKLQADDPILKNGDEFLKLAKDTYEKLIPLYRMSFE